MRPKSELWTAVPMSLRGVFLMGVLLLEPDQESISWFGLFKEQILRCYLGVSINAPIKGVILVKQPYWINGLEKHNKIWSLTVWISATKVVWKIMIQRTQGKAGKDRLLLFHKNTTRFGEKEDEQIFLEIFRFLDFLFLFLTLHITENWWNGRYAAF